MHRVILMGAGGRAFHNFNLVYRDDPDAEVVAFAAAPSSGVAAPAYPAALAGPRYPDGIPILPEELLADLVERERVDEVVLADSELAHEDVMHRASVALAAGASFSLLGPRATMLESTRPVVAVCAARTGSGKSAASRRIVRLLLNAGVTPAIVLHPTRHEDLAAARVRRFATLAELDATRPTLEDREEIEWGIELGVSVHEGVDYGAVLEQAEAEAEVIVWDGGWNDFPFVRPDLLVVVVDALRAGHELSYHPGETSVRMADVVVVNKVDSAGLASIERVLTDVAAVNPTAVVVKATSPAVLDRGPSLMNAAVVVVEDGRTITRGGLPFGAGTAAAQAAAVGMRIDPRERATGTLAKTYERYPHIGSVVPALGDSDEQLRELERLLNELECDAVVNGARVDLARLIECRHPIRRASYELRELGEPTLESVLAPLVQRVRAAHVATG